MIFAAPHSVPYMAYIVHVVTGVLCGEVGICDARVCVLFVSSRSGMVFNPSAGAITNHSKSAKDRYPYFKSQLYAEDPGRTNPVLNLPNELSKPKRVSARQKFNFFHGEIRTHARNLISDMGRIRTHNLFIDSPACYH